MSSSLVLCLCVAMATVVHYCYGHCTTKYCEEGEEGLNKNLMEQVQYLLQEVSRIREITATQQQQYASLQAKQNELENKLKQVERKQTGMQDEKNKRRPPAAFHVYRDNLRGIRFIPDSRDVIPFNAVITNIGGGFNTTTHKFWCPVSGVYAFWFTIDPGDLPFDGKIQLQAQLMMDGKGLSTAYCYKAGSEQLTMMCSNQAVIECQAGSQVWVHCTDEDLSTCGNGDAWSQTTFSGFLLRWN